MKGFMQNETLINNTNVTYISFWKYMYKHFSCSMYFIIINAFEFVLPAIVESIEFILIFLLISIILGIQFISEKT